MIQQPPVRPPFGLSPRRLRLVLIALLMLLVLLYLWRSIFIPIGSGRAGVLWSRFGGGTDLSHPYGEGYQAIWPWDRMAVYDTRLQEMHGPVDVLTIDGLQVTLDVTARFRPRIAALPTLHRLVGPQYRTTVVWPDVVSAVRHVVRRLKPDDLRVLGETDLGARIDGAARQAVSGHWVDLDRVLITRITLPKRLQDEIQDRLAQEQKALAYPDILRQAEGERQRRLIEAEGVRAFEQRAHVSALKWRAIEATEHLAASPGSKVIVMGAGQTPVMINPDK